MKNFKNKLGIMQGRLSSPYPAHYQSFPWRTWKEEFFTAQELNIDYVEWVYDKPYEKNSPLKDRHGFEEVLNIIQQTGVPVLSICADFFMSELLLINGQINSVAVLKLKYLIDLAEEIDSRHIVLPFVDASKITTSNEIDTLIDLLQREIGPYAAKKGIELHIESDFAPSDFHKFLTRINMPETVKINLDIGNSAALGWLPEEEIDMLGGHIGSIHIKDRLFNGGTVPLGTGDANFPKMFGLLKNINYSGNFTIQAARGPSGDERQTAQKQIDFCLNLLNSLQ